MQQNSGSGRRGFLRVDLGVLQQSFPSLIVHPLGIASLRPVDVLLTGGNQGDGSLDPNLHTIMTIGQCKIFLTQEMLNKLRENLRLRLLGKEMGEQACKRGASIANIGA
jgi:hypothetical protein